MPTDQTTDPTRVDVRPHSSDRPAAVEGPWRAVLHTQGGWVVPTGLWFGDEGAVTVTVVRGSALPVTEGASGEQMPGSYDPGDVLWEYEELEDEEAEDRWAQARMVAALLNANEERLDRVAEEAVSTNAH